MRVPVFVVLFLLSLCASAGESFTLKAIDASLTDIAEHARQYPLRFESEAQRGQIESELLHDLYLLDKAVISYPDNTDILRRAAFANAMGHNLDLPGCAEKAVQSYEHLLQINPADANANYYYGLFLSGTKLFEKSPPYLKKAIELGEPQAHYALAFVYIMQGDPKKALPEFLEYLKVDPDNDRAKKMVADIEA